MDAHNIVPCWVASPKLEYAARTIRGKITKQLPEFLTDFPPVEKHPHAAGPTAQVRPPSRNLSRKYGGLWRSTLERDLLTFGPSSPSQPVDWKETLSSLSVDRTVGETAWARPGARAGLAMLESFIDERLKRFDSQRNDPNVAALSQMSPWIRFGESPESERPRLPAHEANATSPPPQATCRPSGWRCRSSAAGRRRAWAWPPSSRSWWCAGS